MKFRQFPEIFQFSKIPKRGFPAGWQNPRKISVKEFLFYYLLKLDSSTGSYHGTL